MPLGSPYSITVESVGYSTEARNDLSLNLGDPLLFDFSLTEKVTQLEEVVVKRNLVNSRIDRLGASTAISAKTIQQIPAQNRNFTNLAALAPTTNGSSISGQRASSSNYTILDRLFNSGISGLLPLLKPDYSSSPPMRYFCKKIKL